MVRGRALLCSLLMEMDISRDIVSTLEQDIHIVIPHGGR